MTSSANTTYGHLTWFLMSLTSAQCCRYLVLRCCILGVFPHCFIFKSLHCKLWVFYSCRDYKMNLNLISITRVLCWDSWDTFRTFAKLLTEKVSRQAEVVVKLLSLMNHQDIFSTREPPINITKQQRPSPAPPPPVLIPDLLIMIDQT